MKPCARERRPPLSLETLELRVLLAADADAWKAALGADSLHIKGHIETSGPEQMLILRGHGNHSTLILDTDQIGAQVEKIYIRAVDRVTLTGSRNFDVIELEDVKLADLGEVTVNLDLYANDVRRLQVDSPHLFAVIDGEKTIIQSSHFEDALVLTNAGELRLSSQSPVVSLSLVGLGSFNRVEMDFSVARLNLAGFTAPPKFVAPFPALLLSAPPVTAGADAPDFPAPTADVVSGPVQLAAPGEIYFGLPTDVSVRLPEKLAGVSSPVSLSRAVKLANFIAQAIEVTQNPADAPAAAPTKTATPDLAAPVVPAALKINDEPGPEAKKPAAPAAGSTLVHAVLRRSADPGWLYLVRGGESETVNPGSSLAEISLDRRVGLPGSEKEAAARPAAASVSASLHPASGATTADHLPAFRVPSLHEADRGNYVSSAPMEEILPHAAPSRRFGAGRGLWPYESYVQLSELKGYLLDQLLAEITPGERSVLLTELSETRPASFVLV